MKIIFAFLLSLSSVAFSTPNSIIAIVNDTVITMDSISAKINKKTTVKQKIALVQQQIDIALQKEKIQTLGITLKADAVNKVLDNVAKQNGLTIAQLRSNNQFEQIVATVTQNLTLNGLEKMVLQQANITLTQAEIDETLANNPKKSAVTAMVHLANIKAQLIRVKQIAFFQGWIKSLRKDAYIEIFTDKLK
ncbi:hypothetical protein [Candidatus Thiodubiliella endoseptemdiera]|uniref:SurA N-terminal domain-containing protein n=1 Tax=Candidatus Thiodubiliella endoseptemdiera TaxID=2738886 RepID=A0A853EZ95_9GAMM|nr:hypothetical protein [Candidatus Thiodubiliella endoseptemdiera]